MYCSYHSDAPSSGACSACGRALCPSCTHQIKERPFCQDCLVTGADWAAQLRTGAVGDPDPGRAAWLSVIPALGAIYNGQYLKAVTHFAVFSAFCIMSDDVHGVFGLAAFIFYFYMIFDSYRSAQLLRQQRLAAGGLTDSGISADVNSPFWGVVLILLGVLFIGRNLGFFSFNFIREAWPVVFIVVGAILIYRSYAAKRSSVPFWSSAKN